VRARGGRAASRLQLRLPQPQRLGLEGELESALLRRNQPRRRGRLVVAALVAVALAVAARRGTAASAAATAALLAAAAAGRGRWHAPRGLARSLAGGSGRRLVERLLRCG